MKKVLILFSLIFLIILAFGIARESIGTDLPMPNLALCYANMNRDDPNSLNNHPEAKYNLVILNFSTMQYAENFETSLQWFITNAKILKQRRSDLKLFIYLTINTIEGKYYPALYDWFATIYDSSLVFSDDMYLLDNDERIVFDPSYPTIYLLDIRKEIVRKYICNVACGVIQKLNFEFNDLNIKINLFYDMLEEESRAKNIISNNDWIYYSKEILNLITSKIPTDTMVLANAGKNYSVDCLYLPYLHGFMLENFLGSDPAFFDKANPDYRFGASLSEGISSITQTRLSCKSPRIIILNTDEQLWSLSEEGRYLSYALSRMYEEVYHSHDNGKVHGSPDWSLLYEANLGIPLGAVLNTSYNNQLRNFSLGSVLVTNSSSEMAIFKMNHTDLFSKATAKQFEIAISRGRIFKKVINFNPAYLQLME
ncbi:MAG: putative glycoside hydrolase [Thermodesulfobacteriota bacterium]